MESNDNRLELGGVVNPLLPSNPSESYLTAILPPGSYTAVVEGVDGTSGVALVELYDLEPGVSRVANISTRGDIASANDVMIGGFIVGSGDPTKVIVRALGPSLAAFGRDRIHYPIRCWNLRLGWHTGRLRTTTGVRLRHRKSKLPSRRRTISSRPLWLPSRPAITQPWCMMQLTQPALGWSKSTTSSPKAGCLARTRTLTKRSRISRATITPRGTAEERELSPGRASAQVTTRRAGV